MVEIRRCLINGFDILSLTITPTQTHTGDESLVLTAEIGYTSSPHRESDLKLEIGRGLGTATFSQGGVLDERLDVEVAAAARALLLALSGAIRKRVDGEATAAAPDAPRATPTRMFPEGF